MIFVVIGLLIEFVYKAIEIIFPSGKKNQLNLYTLLYLYTPYSKFTWV